MEEHRIYFYQFIGSLKIFGCVSSQRGARTDWLLSAVRLSLLRSLSRDDIPSGCSVTTLSKWTPIDTHCMGYSSLFLSRSPFCQVH